MHSHLQLCTVAMVATVAWPICFLAGADPRWLAWHFHFLVWAWTILGGFAAALALSDHWERKLEEWSLVPVGQSPLAWLTLVAVGIAHIVLLWLWLTPVRSEYRRLSNNASDISTRR